MSGNSSGDFQSLVGCLNEVVGLAAAGKKRIDGGGGVGGVGGGLKEKAEVSCPFRLLPVVDILRSVPVFIPRSINKVSQIVAGRDIVLVWRPDAVYN
jgi:hypothetical protein